MRAIGLALVLGLTLVVLPGPAHAPALTFFTDDAEGAALWDASGLWHLSSNRSHSSSHSYYFGQEGSWSYDTGAVESGSLTTHAPIDLTATNNATLTFWQFLDSEGPPYDQGHVQVSTDGGGNWTEVAVNTTTNGTWQQTSVDLSDHTFSSLYLRFFFDTVDAIDNAHEGWYVDDILITGEPEPRDLRLQSLSGPERVMAGEGITLTAVVTNDGFGTETGAELAVTMNGTSAGAPTPIGPLASRESRTVLLNFTVPSNGLVRFAVTVSNPGSPERALADNTRTHEVVVNVLKAGIYFHDDATDVAYWDGEMENTDWLVNQTVLTDTEYRFYPVTLTSLTAASLAGIDVLVFTDNAPTLAELPALDAWFRGGAGAGRGLVLIHRAAALGAYQGYLWPTTVGTNAYGTHWDSAGTGNDMDIVLAHKITENYSVGQGVPTYQFSTSYFVAQLPPDTLVLAEDSADSRIAYVIARQVAGGGKVAGLGPFWLPLPGNELRPMILDAMEWTATPPEDHDLAALWVTTPEIARRGTPLPLQARVTNDGQLPEVDVDVEFRVDGALQGAPQRIATIAPGGSMDLSFSWTPTTEAEHTVEVRAVAVPGESVTANNAHAWKIATWDRPKQGKFALVSDEKQLDVNAFRNLVDSTGIPYDRIINNNNTEWLNDLSNLMDYEGLVVYTSAGSTLEESRALRIYTKLGGSLLVTGSDSLVSTSPLEEVLGVLSIGDAPVSVNSTVVNPDSPAVNGPYGTWPFGAYFWSLDYNQDAVFVRPGTGTSSILRLRDGYEKLTYRRVGDQGKALYWNGDGEKDWTGDTAQGDIFRNVLKWMGLKDVDLEMVSLDLPKFAYPGQTVYANFTLVNRGILPTAAFVVRLLQNGTETGSVPLPALAPGVVASGSIPWSNPFSDLYGLVVEAAAVPGETFTANNRMRREILISTVQPIKAAVYYGAGTADVWTRAAWQSLGRNFLRYGTIPLAIDVDSLNHNGVTYDELVTLDADVIILTNMGLVPNGELTTQEMTDLLRYTFRGHGLVSVGFTITESVPNNAMLGPVFGIRQDIRAGFNYSTGFNLTNVTHPIAAGLPAWYTPRNNISFVPLTSFWNTTDLEGGRVVLASNGTVGAVIEHRGLYLLTPWLDSFPKKDDSQLLYNAVTLSKFGVADVDVAPIMLEYPKFLEPNETAHVRSGIWNLGTQLIGSAVAVLSLDGVTLTAKEVRNITAGDVQTVDFSFATTQRGTHNFTIDVIGVAGELPAAQGNNNISVGLVVQPIVGRVRFGPVPYFYDNAYEILRREARARGYSVESTYVQDFRPGALAPYDAIVIPVPSGTYSDADVRSLQHYVAGGRGLFIFGSSNATLFTRLTGFAGINWTVGDALPGPSTNIYPHEVTRGVGSVVIGEPELNIGVAGNATAVAEDGGKAGQRQVVAAVSEVPGRVAAMSDETMLWNELMIQEDNGRLAVNLIEWLVRADQRTPSKPAPPFVSAVPEGSALQISVTPLDEVDVEWYRIWVSEDPGGAGGFVPVADLPALQTTFVHTNLTNGQRYYYRVTAVDWFGLQSPFSEPASGVPIDLVAPAPPTGLQLTAVGLDTLHLRWDPSTSADTTSYRVYYALGAGPFDLLFETFSPSILDFTHPGLAESIDHRYYVTAVDTASWESGPSAVITGRLPDGTPPQTPTGLSARPVPTGGALNVTWNANLDDTAFYSVWWDDGTGWRFLQNFTPRENTGFVHAPLTNGLLYCYNITATDVSNNTSPPSTPACRIPQVSSDLVPPGQVLNLAVTSGPEGEELVLTWDPVPDLDVLEYMVELVNGTTHTQVTSVLAPVTGFTHRPLIDGTLYSYRVTAFDNSSNAGPSSAIVSGTPVDTTPPLPPGLTGMYDDTAAQIRLSWSASASLDVERYQVWRGTAPGVHSLLVADVSSFTTQAADAALVGGFTYYYVATACDEVPLCSTPSVEVTIYVPVPTPVQRPSGLWVEVLPPGNSLRLHWNAATDPNVTTYRTFVNATPSPPFIWQGTSIDIPSGVPLDTVVGLVDGVRYCFTVQSVWATGERSTYADFACGVPADSLAPGAPDDLTATALSIGNVIHLSWGAEIGTDAQEQILHRAGDAAFTNDTVIARLPAEVGQYRDTGLVDGQPYYYRIQVADEVPNLSGYSNTAVAVPLDLAAPANPRDLLVTLVSSDPLHARLIWEPVADNDVDHYTIYRSTAGRAPVAIGNVSAGNEFVDTSIVLNETYSYYITASDEVPNESGRSNLVVFAATRPGGGGGGGGGGPSGGKTDFLVSGTGQLVLLFISLVCVLALFALLLDVRRRRRKATPPESAEVSKAPEAEEVPEGPSGGDRGPVSPPPG